MKSIKVKHFERMAASGDGKIAKFNVCSVDGESLELQIPVTNIGGIIAFLAELSQFAERGIHPDQLAEVRAHGKNCGHSITPLNVGLAQAQHETILSVHLGQFSLGFPITTAQLISLKEEVNKIPLPAIPPPHQSH